MKQSLKNSSFSKNASAWGGYLYCSTGKKNYIKATIKTPEDPDTPIDPKRPDPIQPPTDPDKPFPHIPENPIPQEDPPPKENPRK
ncbi:MAG: hypothetical protein BGO43_07775 [Gammaproteobacteria bacterium 39-13]|nr:hypothetical protein [Gammaproteobacteria bacterium]OJV93066.1 MAG: hypothetical protein BGO43_07775 [Gammaproteobacteria bacterium 39-13]